MHEKPAIGGPFSRSGKKFYKIRTGWLATQWDSNLSPRVFPANREFYREIAGIRGSGLGNYEKSLCAAAVSRQFPKRINREFSPTNRDQLSRISDLLLTTKLNLQAMNYAVVQ
jgi:hypothetical protein